MRLSNILRGGGRLFAALLLIATFSFSSCAQLNSLLGNEDDDDREFLLLSGLLGIAILSSSTSSCTNNSGMVICIPTGLSRN